MQERIVKFFKEQFAAFNFTTQFGGVIAGVQSGKTFLGAHWAGKKICEFPTKDGIIVSPSYKILQQATLRKFFDIFPELRVYHKEQKGEIHLPTGGIVYLRSADNPLGIEGISPMWWWLDEGGMTSPLTWTVLRSRVSMTGGQGIITTTPYNLGWLYKDFYLRWQEGKDKNFSFFTWKSIENPYFSKEFYEAEKSRLRAEEFSRRYMGEFRKMTGLVYDILAEQIIDPKDIQFKSERIMGIDWGFQNPAAIAILYFYDKQWFVVDEWKNTRRTTAEIIQVAKNKMTEHRITRIFPDPAEPDRIEECRRENLPMMETNKDLKGGISYIQQLIKEKRFFIFNNCQETITEASMYHYPEEENKEGKDEPVKFNDHIMDAMRYAIYSYKPINAAKPIATAPISSYYPEIGL